MSEALVLTTPAPAQLELIQRAAELGIECWCFDLTGALTSGQTPTAAVLAAAECRDGPSRVIIAAGRSLLAIPGASGVVVADLTEYSPAQQDRLIKVLNCYQTDIERAARDAIAIEGFSQQLSQSYEEVNLIYRMATLLTNSGDPREVVETMCEELRATLCYDWLSMMFDRSEAVLAPLQGTVTHAGQLPCDETIFHAAAAELDPAVDGRVITPAQKQLAALAGSELLADRVMHGDTKIGLLIAGNRQGDDPDITSSDLQLAEAAAKFFGLFHQNAFRFAAQRQQFLGTLHALSAAVDAKDPYTQGHSERVGLLAAKLAAKLGFSATDVESTRVAGLLHDIGKIGVPEAVLQKPARLTEAEFEQIKRHPEIGYQILKDLPSLRFHLPGVLHHHERWDGGGYPYKLSGEQIPMIARIMAFADTFDAMSSNRAYRKAMDRDHVLNEIRKSAGGQFDPQLVEQFVSLDFSDFDRLLQSAQAKHVSIAA